MERKAVLALTVLVLTLGIFGMTSRLFACERGEFEMEITDDQTGEKFGACYLIGFDDHSWPFIGPTSWDVWGAVDLSNIIGKGEANAATCVFNAENIRATPDTFGSCGFSEEAPVAFALEEDSEKIESDPDEVVEFLESSKPVNRGVEVAVALSWDESPASFDDVVMHYGSEYKFRTRDKKTYTGSTGRGSLGSRTVMINSRIPHGR